MSQTISLMIQIITSIVFLLMIVPASGNFVAGIMGMVQENASRAWRVVAVSSPRCRSFIPSPP
jgi:hypothetical protein